MLAVHRRQLIERLESRRLLAAVPVVVDLLVVYTPAAAALHGGNVGIDSLIQGSVDSMNLALSNSRISVTARLVHSEPISYSGSNNLQTDRQRMENPADSYMDNLPALRNQYGADAVLLITDGPNINGGIANLMVNTQQANNDTLAFSAISEKSIGLGNYTLAHEVGHILGAGHERNNPTEPAVGPFFYSYGYRFSAGGVVYHDIMSYDPGIGIPYFANPAVSYHGVPTGSTIGAANEADLASTFAVTAPIVAAYRPTVVADSTPRQAELYEVSQVGQVINFTVRYTDDTGIDQTTIDSNDILVGVAGYSMAAGLLSVRNPGVGQSFKLATYRVVVPSPGTPLSSITFFMRPNAVRDINNHFVPIGSVANETSDTTDYGYASARDLGTLSLNETRTLHEQLEQPATDETYQFALTQPATVSVKLSELSADAQVFFVKDTNGDGLYSADEYIDGSFNTGTTDESVSLNLPAGTYFVWVFNTVTPYTLSLHAYNDVTAPTAVLDATDIKSGGGSQFVFNVVFKDDIEMNAFLTRYYTPVRVSTPLGGYYITFADSIDAEFNAVTRTATYRINVGHSLSASDNGIYTVSMEPQNSAVWGVGTPLDNYVSDAAGHKLVPGTLGTFRVAIGQADSSPPTATASVDSVLIGGASTWDIAVTYRDNVALDSSTLDGNDLRVTGPNGFNQLASFISVSAAPAIGAARTAIYRMAAPGGSFDPLDDGLYTVALQANQVRDSSNNAAAVSSLVQFNVAVPLNGDSNRDGIVDIKDLYALASNYLQAGRGFNEGDFNYDGRVDASDLGLLALNWQKTQILPAAIVPTSLNGARRAPARMINLVS